MMFASRNNSTSTGIISSVKSFTPVLGLVGMLKKQIISVGIYVPNKHISPIENVQNIFTKRILVLRDMSNSDRISFINYQHLNVAANDLIYLC